MICKICGGELPDEPLMVVHIINLKKPDGHRTAQIYRTDKWMVAAFAGTPDQVADYVHEFANAEGVNLHFHYGPLLP